jgi:hypothetical protein
MKHRFIFILFIVFVSISLFAQSSDLLGESDLKNREVETVDLGEIGKNKLKLGLAGFYPMAGVTAGWQVGESLELDFTAGSLYYDSFALGAGAMISLLDLKIGEEIFPITLGPVLYTGFGGENDFIVSLGGLARTEYTFDFNLNLYIESGLVVNLTEWEDNALAVPFSLGIRYIF